MYEITINKKNFYSDICMQTKPIKKQGFCPYKKAEVTIAYDKRSNELKSSIIKMREIKDK